MYLKNENKAVRDLANKINDDFEEAAKGLPRRDVSNKEMIDFFDEAVKGSDIDKSNRNSLLGVSEDYKAILIFFPHGEIYTGTAGELLIDFVELDYYTFFSHHQTILKCRGFFIEQMDRDEYEDIQEDFKEIVNYCFSNIHTDNKDEIIQKYGCYVNNIEPDFESYIDPNLRLTFSYVNNNLGAGLLEGYWFTSLKDVFYFELINAVRGNINIKKCCSCGKFFIPEGRKDTKFCNRVAPPPNSSGKTCKEVGSNRLYKKDKADTPIYKAFYREYKKRDAWVTYQNHLINGHIYDTGDFNSWKAQAAEKRDELMDDEDALNRFNKWLAKYDKVSKTAKRDRSAR